MCARVLSDFYFRFPPMLKAGSSASRQKILNCVGVDKDLYMLKVSYQPLVPSTTGHAEPCVHVSEVHTPQP